MVISRHLGFYRTGNCAIRSAVPENPCLEPNMEWIGCTICERGICEIFGFKLYCDLETGFWGHSRSLKAALFDRAHTTLYSSSTCGPELPPFRNIAAYLVENCYPLYLAPPLGVKPSDLRNDPRWRKTRMKGLSDGERISTIRSAVLIQYTRVTDGRMDRRNWRGITRYTMMSRVILS